VKMEESNASSKLVQRPRFVQRSRIQNHGRNAIWEKVLAQGIARNRKESQARVRRTLSNQLRPLWDVHLLILSVHLKILRYDPTQIHHLLVGEMDTRPCPPRCAHPVQKCRRGLDVRKRALLASLPCRVFTILGPRARCCDHDLSTVSRIGDCSFCLRVSPSRFRSRFRRRNGKNSVTEDNFSSKTPISE
jgi:hypothetical protein